MKVEKSWGSILKGAAVCLLLLGGCPLAVMEDYAVPGGSRETGAVITGYNLQSIVPVPVAGEVPVTGLTGRSDLDLRVRWRDGEGVSPEVFVPDAVYQADITLTAKGGFSFDPGMSFKYPEGSVAVQPADNAGVGSRSLSTVTYLSAKEPEAVSGDDLARYIPRPAVGGVPLASFSAAAYTGTVKWVEGDSPSGMVEGLFMSGTEYRAEVALETVSGYTFRGIPAKAPGAEAAGAFRHSLSSDISHGEGEGRTLEVVIRFPAAAGPQQPGGEDPQQPGGEDPQQPDGDSPPGIVDGVIQSVDLTKLIPVPLEYDTPVTTFLSIGCGGIVAWKTGDTEVEGAFRLNTPYTAEITLWAVPGYALGLATTVTHTGAHPASVVLSNGKAALSFPAIGGYVKYSGGFSGNTLASPDSAIDLIRAAKAGGRTALTIELSARGSEEPVDLTAVTDFGTTGLVLTATNSPADLTIDGGGRILAIVKDDTLSNTSLITVGSGMTLTLRNITFKGKVNSGGERYPMIQVKDGGKLIFDTGMVILDNLGSLTLSNAAGVDVTGSGSEFTMNGGSISNTAQKAYYNAGSGVTVGTGAAFIMNGGSIIDSPSYTGAVYVNGGVFTMKGGIISGNQNRSSSHGGGGGGVQVVNGGSFTMTDGVIRDNQAKSGGGVYGDSTSTFLKTGGAIYGDTDATHTAGSDENTATEGASGKGHAVYFNGKYRDATAGPLVNLNSGNTTNWTQ